MTAQRGARFLAHQRRFATPNTRELDRIIEIRAGMERACELCREDPRTMVDRERGR